MGCKHEHSQVDSSILDIVTVALKAIRLRHQAGQSGNAKGSTLWLVLFQCSLPKQMTQPLPLEGLGRRQLDRLTDPTAVLPNAPSAWRAESGNQTTEGALGWPEFVSGMSSAGTGKQARLKAVLPSPGRVCV